MSYCSHHLGAYQAVIIYLSIHTTSKNIDLAESFSHCKIKSVFYISRFASSKNLVSQYFIRNGSALV